MKEGKIVFKKWGKNKPCISQTVMIFLLFPHGLSHWNTSTLVTVPKMNHLFFYEMSITVNNMLGKAFNKEMKVAGWYKWTCFMSRWPNPRGVWQLITNWINVPTHQSTLNSPYKKLPWFKSPKVVNQTVKGGMGRLFTPSWKSLLITENLHLQITKNWIICKSEILYAALNQNHKKHKAFDWFYRAILWLNSHWLNPYCGD